MRSYFLNIPIDDLSIKEIAERFISGQKTFQIFLNIRKIGQLYNNSNFKSITDDEDSIFSADGNWVKWINSIKGFRVKGRFGGLDVIKEFFALTEKHNLRIYLLGATEDVIKATTERLRHKFKKANIVGFQNGFSLSENEIIRQINDVKPDVLFIALPSPQKELLGYKIFKKVDSLKYVAGVGGAFNIIAGKTKRAPLWAQYIGMEWFYRCLQQPSAMFKRYYDDGIEFIKILFKQLTRKLK